MKDGLSKDSRLITNEVGIQLRVVATTNTHNIDCDKSKKSQP